MRRFERENNADHGILIPGRCKPLLILGIADNALRGIPDLDGLQANPVVIYFSPFRFGLRKRREQQQQGDER